MSYLFILVPIAILFLAHWAIYAFLVRIFILDGKVQKIILASALFVLAIGFVLSSMLVHFWSNFFSSFLYLVFGWWYGVMINLLMAITVYWILNCVYRLSRKATFNHWVGRTLAMLAIAFSIYGLIAVFFPTVREVSVKIDALPDVWKGARIVQLSDLHLGRVLGDGFMHKVARQVNALQPDLIFITGDLFDGMGGDPDSFIPALDSLSAMKGVYYITGNHEVYVGKKMALDTMAKTNIVDLNDKVIQIDGLQLVGVAYPEGLEQKDIKEIIESNENFNHETPSILLYHSPTDFGADRSGMDHASIYFSPNLIFKSAEDLGIDLQLSGHTHRGQIFPFNIISELIYHGLDHGLHRIGDFQIYISPGTGVWGPTMRTGSRSEITMITLE